jgi:hypothetical protein
MTLRATYGRSAILCLLLTAPAAAMAVPNMEEGNWQVTIKMEMVGMPMAMPPQTINQCLSKKDDVPDMGQGDQKCYLKDHKVEGNTVRWQMQCKGQQGTMDGAGRITYSGKTYEGTMQMKMTEAGGEAMAINYQMQGKHTGPCRPDSRKAARKKDDY